MIALATIMLSLSVQDDVGASRYSHTHMPPHGTLHEGRLYGFFAIDAFIYAVPIANPAKDNWKSYGVSIYGDLHCRHHFTKDTIWYISGRNWVFRMPLAELSLFDLSNKDRFEQYKKKYPAQTIPVLTQAIPVRSHSWTLGPLAEKYWRLQAMEFAKEGDPGARVLSPPKGLAGMDCVPISENSCRVFYYAKETKKIESWETEARYDAKKQFWDIVTEDRNPEAIEAPFAEDFYAFIRKNDYYFITQSGKLYHAPPPKKGEKSRTMKSLWQGDKFPIAAVIEDADNDKVWLFTKAKNKLETQGVFFEMAAELHKQPFDHAKLAPVNVEGRARPLLEYLPLIRDKAKQPPLD